MSADVDEAFNVLLLVYGTYVRAEGFRLNWVISDPDSSEDSETGNLPLALNNAIQSVILPHGDLTADQEIIYFTHASRSGIAFIKRRNSSFDDIHIESLAVISPTPVSSQPQTWHYISDLKNILATCPDAETTRQAAKSWHSTKVVKRVRSVRILDSKTVTWEEQLADSAYHPLHNLPFFLRVFGPSFVTLYKYVLARMRVVIYVPPGIPTNNVSQKPGRDNDPDDFAIPKAADTSPLLTRPCELASTLTHILPALCGGKDRPYSLGFLDDDRLTLFDQSTDSGFGWIACTANKQTIHSHLYNIDLVVDLSPVFNSPSLLDPEKPTVSNTFDGVRTPLLLVPSSSPSPAALEPSLEVRPTRFTLLDIQLWSDAQSVMKRIDRSKQRALRSHERGRQGMNGSRNQRNGSRQGRTSISDSEDWDDGDFLVPGGWSANGNSQRLEKGSSETDEVASSSVSMIVQEDNETNGVQPPQLPQKSTYTLDLITAFHRHVVSLSKSYATMATTNTPSFSTTSSAPSSVAVRPTVVSLPTFEFDDLEKAFLEGGRRRRGSSLNGTSNSLNLSVVSEHKVNQSHRDTSTTISVNSSDAATKSSDAASCTTMTLSDKQTSVELLSQSPTQSPKVALPSANRSSSTSRSPPRRSASSNGHTPSKSRSRSRSSSRDSVRTAPVSPNTDTKPQSKIPKPLSELHVTLGSPSTPGPYSPPPYPYTFPTSYPKRPDTVTSFASIPTSQFATLEHSPILTARNSPVGDDSREGTPIPSAVKGIKLDDIEPLDMPRSVVLPSTSASEGGNGPKQEDEEEKVIPQENDKAEDEDDGDQPRNSVSFPSSAPLSKSLSAQLILPSTTTPTSKPKSKFFWHKKSLSDDVSSNLHVPSKTETESTRTSTSTSPSRSGRESPATVTKKSKHTSPGAGAGASASASASVSVVLPTDLQILEVEAELREQEARMLAPSPTPPELVSPKLGPRRVKGWSVPTEVFLGRREKEEVVKDEMGGVDAGGDVLKEETKAEAAVEEKDEGGGDGDANDAERNLVLTPVEVLWERRRETSASPPQDPSARSASPSSSPPPTNNNSTGSTSPSTSQPLLQAHLFEPQPLPPGAANPTPNVGPVITSIIDVLRGAIALHGDAAATAAATAVAAATSTNGDPAAHVDDDLEPPLPPPPPLPALSGSPARTPTPQSGRGTPRGLPKIDEEEEEEASIISEKSADAEGRVSHDSSSQTNRHRRLRSLRHHVGIGGGGHGHATDSGDAADAEGADGDGDGDADGETESASSSVTAACSVSFAPPGLGLGLGPGMAAVNASNGTGAGVGVGGSVFMEYATSSSSPVPPSPGFLSTTTATASSPSVLLPPSPRALAPSPSPSSSNGLRILPSPSPSPRPEVATSPAPASFPSNSNDAGISASKKPSSPSSNSNSNSPTPPTPPTPQQQKPSSKKSSPTPSRGHAASTSMSNPAPSTPPTSLISNLTKSLSLSIRPRRISLLSANSSSNSNGKKADGNPKSKDAVTGASGSSKKKNDNVNMKSRSAPGAIGSTGSSDLVGGSSGTNASSSPAISQPTTNPASTNTISPAGSSSITTSPSSVSSGSGMWIKRPRIRTRPITTSTSSGSEPVFNMVTLMSAEEARSLGIEEWNGRNSGVGTLALANEMRRAQAEKSGVKSSGSGSGSASTSGVAAAAENEIPDTSANHDGTVSSVITPPLTSSSPSESRPSALSGSKFAPPPKKGILRGRRVSLTALPSSTTEKNLTGLGRAASTSTSTINSTSPPAKPNQKSKSTPILKQAKSLTSTPRSSTERNNPGAGAAGPVAPPSHPPPPPSAEPMSPTSMATRSPTPDSARRKLRKRRKSLVEPSGSGSNSNNANANVVDARASIPA